MSHILYTQPELLHFTTTSTCGTYGIVWSHLCCTAVARSLSGPPPPFPLTLPCSPLHGHCQAPPLLPP